MPEERRHVAQFGNADTVIWVYADEIMVFGTPQLRLKLTFNGKREEIYFTWECALRAILRETERTEDKSMHLEWVKGGVEEDEEEEHE